MSGKTVDVDLRIRAKNLSKSSLKDINDDVEKLTQAQTEQAKSADLAARSMRDLITEQKKAADLSKELSKRRGALQQYVDERAEIEALAKKLVELTALRKRVSSAAPQKGVPGVSVAGLDTNIVNTEKRLRKLTEATETSRLKMEALGIETADTGKTMAVISTGVDKANAAYDRATANVNGYSAAVQRANEVQAEATRRTQQEAAARERVTRVAREDAARAGTAAALKADILARDKQAKALAISAEAARRLRQEEELEASALARGNAGVQEAIRRLNELNVLRADIVRRSKETVAQQNAANAATQREAAIQAASNERRQRLIALIQSEKGQRLLGLEAQRQEAAQAGRTAAAKDKLATATGRAAREQALFADTGRKSLSVYQRVRGQVLGLITAYVGVYQAINTVSNAISAVNRDQSLRIGLSVANSGDLKAVASDYKFLREEADRLGLVFDDIAPKYANMVIAAKAVGVSAKETRDLFSQVATSVAAGNLSIDDSEGVFRAVVQVMGKARVQAEELRGQLGDRLPGAVAKFAEANNIALTDLDKHLKDGKGSIEEFLKFMKQYAEQYAPAMEAANDRLQATINRAKNAYNDWLRKLLDSSAQSKLKEAFAKITEFFNGKDGEKFAEALGKAFSTLVDVFILLADNIDLVSKALKIFISVQAIKFALDLTGGIVGLAKGFGTAATTATAAAGATSGMARALGFLKIALGGLAVLITGVTVAIQSQSEILAQAEPNLRRYANLMDKVGRRMGVAKAATVEEANANIKAIGEESAATFEELKKLEAFQKKARAAQAGGTADKVGFVLKTAAQSAFGGEAKDLGIGIGTTFDDLQKRIDAARAKIFNLREMMTDELSVRLELTGKELQDAADAAAKTVTTATEKADKPKKAPKGRDPEDIKRQQEAAQSALVALASRTEEEIAQTRIQKNATTDAQIEENRVASLEKIKQDTIQSLEQVAAIRRQYENAGLDTANDPRFKQMDELLKKLEAAKVARVEEDAITARIELREKAINDLIAERDAKIQLQNTLQETGQQTALTTQTNVNKLQDEYNAKIRETIAEFTAFINTLDPTGELYKRLGLDKVLLGLQQINAENVKLSQTQKFFTKWGESIAQTGANMLKAFSDAYAATGKLSDGFKAAGQVFRQFIADFLMQIAQAIIKAIILQAIMNAINGTSGGYGGAVSSALTAGAHTGGVVRSGNKVGANPRRLVSPLVFAGAEKFHGGGLPGLQRDEVASILKRKEEVLAADDPRNILNGGAAASGTTGAAGMTVINISDPEQAAGTILKAQAAGPVLLNFIDQNASAIKARLGIR